MGAFVLGILFGWLLEWLFFNYWIKGRSTGRFADCSGVESDLAAKNREITILKEELKSAKSSENSSKEENTGETVTKKVAENKPDSSEAEKGAGKKDATQSKAVTKKKENTNDKSATESTSSKKNNNSATNTSSKSKGSNTKKATESKKASAKKTPAKKTKSASRKTKTSNGDDLTKLSGIGPSMSKKLNELGISTFKKLSEMDDDILRDMLEASGARLNNNKEAMDSWNEQAALAAKGDFDGLKKLQDSLKS